jgi:murein DD-endopeptidase MepM/ murein hydrolase activator NlpD
MTRWNSIGAGCYPPALEGEEFTASGFPAPFSAVFAGRRFPALTAFRTFFDFALTVGFPFFAAGTGRVHFRVPRAFA